MIWQGRELATTGDLIDAVAAVRSGPEAQEFLRAYRAVNPHAGENVGYVTGYLGREDADRIMALFGVCHPVFGTSHPTPEEAFEAGRRIMADYLSRQENRE